MARYFKGGGPFERTLRFFNLLEPGHMVLSLSKLAVWLSLIGFIYILKYRPDDVASLTLAFVGTATSTGNYAYRRHMQYKSGENPYPDKASPTEDAAMSDVVARTSK